MRLPRGEFLAHTDGSAVEIAGVHHDGVEVGLHHTGAVLRGARRDPRRGSEESTATMVVSAASTAARSPSPSAAQVYSGGNSTTAATGADRQGEDSGESVEVQANPPSSSAAPGKADPAPPGVGPP